MKDLSQYDGTGELRLLDPQWNKAMIAASIAISFLGAFTSTQLMCHARISLRFTSVAAWSLAGSLIFGFCGVWALHEVAMLAYEVDLPIGVDPLLTAVSALLAVLFTFVALSDDLLWDRYQTRHQRRHHNSTIRRGRSRRSEPPMPRQNTQDMVPLLTTEDVEDQSAEATTEVASTRGDDYFSPRSDSRSDAGRTRSVNSAMPGLDPPTPDFAASEEELMAFISTASRTSGESSVETFKPTNGRLNGFVNPTHDVEPEAVEDAVSESYTNTSTSYFSARRGSGYASSGGISSALGMIFQGGIQNNPTPANPFVAIAKLLYAGLTMRNMVKGFMWSIAITSMHYVGLRGLEIPRGYIVFNFWLVALSALISWIVCTVGCILMAHMETHLGQQLVFSVIACLGVAGMHFTGMAASSFYSDAPPSVRQGYPPALATAVVGVAFVTCVAANLLLAHSATVSRNKLAEMVWTRKELWKTIALKENAEAAAKARSDFIASASHEIRTPLHHLQGYSDLLAQTDLTDEGRDLLIAIQRATKTLSLITNNVLDWSKFEREEGAYRPIALDLRSVCESVVTLLPNIDEDSHVELFVAVSPDVPKMIFLDETFIHRILMNLLSNALKFTRNGYILLSIEMENDNLVATVQDTGCGLEPSFVPEMWTPFKQGEVRGSARGTGLGLSIIKQLLKRMKGKIDVKSKYMHLEGVGPANSGTTFTVTIPMSSTMSPPTTPTHSDIPRVAILSTCSDRSLQGMIMAWKAFGYYVEVMPHVSDVHDTTWSFIWADLDFLNEHVDQFKELRRFPDLTVLTPFDTRDSLESLPGILTATNFIMLPKPLIWHTFDKRLRMKKQQRHSAGPTQALRFATEVEVLNDPNKRPPSPPQKISYTVLLVEDNTINQKLGVRMLNALSYSVLTAADGQEAIDILIQHDSHSQRVGGPNIDIILMDQSMPRKDGVTATREIKELEATGKLLKRPIIAVTAVVNSESQAMFREAGADDFLSKPLGLERLKETLSVYLPG